MSDIFLQFNTLYGLTRCPQCGVSNPLVTTVCAPSLHYKETVGGGWFFVTMKCSKCNQDILFYGHAQKSDIGSQGIPSRLSIRKSWPSSKTAHDALPEKARRFLQQALESLHAPDGAVMLAASSVDAMLKEKGYKDGSLFMRIDTAHKAGLLTEQMRDWAHEIRLSANEPRHADDEFPGATSGEARQVIEFAEALGEYLFVLPTRVQKWKSTPTG